MLWCSNKIYNRFQEWEPVKRLSFSINTLSVWQWGKAPIQKLLGAGWAALLLICHWLSAAFMLKHIQQLDHIHQHLYTKAKKIKRVDELSGRKRMRERDILKVMEQGFHNKEILSIQFVLYRLKHYSCMYIYL